MSLSMKTKQDGIVSFVDPRIHFSQSSYGVQFDPVSVRYQRTQIDAYSTNSNVTVSVGIPSRKTVVARTAWLECDMKFQFDGSAGIGNLVTPGNAYDALRQFPFQSCCASTTVDLGTQSFSANCQQFIHELAREIERRNLRTFYSTVPAQSDNYQDYGDAIKFGDALNPLASIGSNDSGISRGGFQYNIVSNSATQTILTVKWLEPIVMPPFSAPSNWDGKGFVGLDRINFNFVLDGSNLTKMWSHSSAGNLLASVTVSYNNPPAVVLQYFEPNVLVSPVPKQLSYNVVQYENYLSAQTSIASGASASLQLPNIALGTIPDMIMLFVKQKESDRTYLSSDSYCRITGISIDFNSRSSLLNDATPQQLFYISCKNGLNYSYPLWQNYLGSILLIKMEDLGLPLGEVSGMLKQTQFQFTVNVTNISGSTRNYQLNALMFYNTIMTKLEDGLLEARKGVVSEDQVVQASSGVTADDGLYTKDELQLEGGSIFKSLGRLVKKGAKALGKYASKNPDKIISIGKALAGAGKKGSRRGGQIVDKEELEDEMDDHLSAYLRRR